MSAPARTRVPREGARPATGKRPTTGKRPASTAWTRPRLVASRLPHAPARTGPRRAPFALLVAGLIIGGMCALLALNTAAAAEELRRHAMAQANADMSADVQQLQARLASHEAPAALARDAAKLGMIPAGNPAFLSIQPDGSVKVLGNPQPATPVVIPSPTPTQQHAQGSVKKPPTTTSPTKPTRSAARTATSTSHAAAPTTHAPVAPR